MQVKKIIKLVLSNKTEVLLFLLFFVFSWFLMWKTFRLDAKGNLLITTKLWSDFAATVPLIRSFSLGANFPPQYPIFAGPPIRYHFLFFLLVGLVEKIGIRLDWALNSLSVLSLFLLLSLIYILTKTVFAKKSVAIVSVILFLFNGSFSFLEFFKKYPPSFSTPTEIFLNKDFPSFGPYDGKIVSAFWNFNIFTNQRHLALAYAGFLCLITIIYLAEKNYHQFTFKKGFFVGLAIGLFPFLHLAVFGMIGVALFVLFLIFPKIRWKIFFIGIVALLLGLPQILYMGKSQVEIPFFNPGYLTRGEPFLSLLKYWFFNLGLTALLTSIGFILAKKEQRKIFLPFLSLFIIGNLFQFSVEIAANHKFFNLFTIGANMFAASFLVFLWQKRLLGKITASLLFFLLTLSGIIDIFPIVNDPTIKAVDIPENRPAAFIAKNTPRNSIFLNAFFLYDPASLAGRKIFLGWPYFSWSAGYDTDKRRDVMQSLLAPIDKQTLCDSLNKEQINYIEIKYPSPLEDIHIDYSFFEDNFVRIYYNQPDEFSIYSVALSCQF